MTLNRAKRDSLRMLTLCKARQKLDRQSITLNHPDNINQEHLLLLWSLVPDRLPCNCVNQRGKRTSLDRLHIIKTFSATT
jgi:hypothetical protein